MATTRERVFVVLDAHDREEAFEITWDVNYRMSLAQSQTSDLPPTLAYAMRKAAVMRAAEQVVWRQAGRRDIKSFTGIWYTRRVPASFHSTIPSTMFPSAEETR